MKREFSMTKDLVTDKIDFVIKWDDITGISGYVYGSTVSPVENATIVLKDLSGLHERPLCSLQNRYS